MNILAGFERILLKIQYRGYRLKDDAMFMPSYGRHTLFRLLAEVNIFSLILDRDRIAPVLGVCGHLQCLSCINAEENPGILFGTNAKCARCSKVGVFKAKMKAICIVGENFAYAITRFS